MSPLSQLLAASAVVAALVAAPIIVPLALLGAAWVVTLAPAMM